MGYEQDRKIIRELAKAYAAIAAEDENAEKRTRAKGINSLRPARPIVWIEEIPWHEMDIDGELTLKCEDERARGIETWLRRGVYRSRHIRVDTYFEPYYAIDKAYEDSGIGVEAEDIMLKNDQANHIGAHRYGDKLKNEADLEKLRHSVLTPRPDIDREKLTFASDMLNGILPVRLRGHGIYHAPWDRIARLRGVEPILMDMADRPDHLHAIRAFYRDEGLSYYAQMETLGLLETDTRDLHCTPPYADELPAPGNDGSHTRLVDVWFRGMAQMFSVVSPAMFEEFELQYQKPLMTRCGLSYYGCCEPLDAFLTRLTAIPNMRKLGVSPWSDVNACAEIIGGKYVAAVKPNPAFVSGRCDTESVKKETETIAKACIRYGCPYEMVLKDISTVSYKPDSLIKWADTVKRVLDVYY